MERLAAALYAPQQKCRDHAVQRLFSPAADPDCALQIDPCRWKAQNNHVILSIQSKQGKAAVGIPHRRCLFHETAFTQELRCQQIIKPFL
jgi:hypothetical protein